MSDVCWGCGGWLLAVGVLMVVVAVVWVLVFGDDVGLGVDLVLGI